MTIQTLINNFRTDINDSTTIFHSDTDILAWVNEAMDYIYEHFKPEPKVTTDS